MNAINYFPCFNKISPQDKEKIIEFWNSEGLSNVVDFNINLRLSQIGFIAKNNIGDVIGISSYYLAKDEYLDANFYYLRASVSKQYRKSGIAANLVEKITHHLEHSLEEADENKSEKPKPTSKGAVIVYENTFLQQFFKGAIVESPTFYFYAFDKKNCPRRVHYFKNAKIID